MGVKWVPANAFHLPELPPELNIDPVLAALLHMACFMELSDEKTVDFDESLSTLEVMAHYFQRLTKKQADQIAAQFKGVVTYGKRQKWRRKRSSSFQRC